MANLESFRKELNLRDLGGYKSEDGRTVKYGLLYRSGALGLFTKEELGSLKEFNLRTVIDFRSKKKCQELPDPEIENCEIICTCAAFENIRDDLNDSPGEFYQMLIDEDQHGNLAATVISSIHAALVYSNVAYECMFKVLLEKRVPLLFHCSQGKDRTGIAAILIMLALGIDEKQIRYDFMLSNTYRKEIIDKKLHDTRLLHKFSDNIRTAIQAVEGVLPEAVHMILAEILERYGTYENFLLKEYKLSEDDLTELRNYYLE